LAAINWQQAMTSPQTEVDDESGHLEKGWNLGVSEEVRHDGNTKRPRPPAKKSL